jgi:hypothetical protein
MNVEKFNALGCKSTIELRDGLRRTVEEYSKM